MSDVVSYTSTDLGSPEADQAYERAVVAAKDHFPHRIVSAIEGREPETTRVVVDVYPGDTDLVVAEVHEVAALEVEHALDAARRGFASWSRTDWRARVECLRAAASAIEADRFEIGAVIAWETGKVRVEAVGEVDEVVALFRYYADCWESERGFTIQMGSRRERAESVLRPYGVWAVISPFNFPFAAAGGMIAGALLGGNTVVFKPDSQVAASGALLARYLRENLPSGSLQMIVGAGEEVGQAMIDNPGFDGYVFTGSRAVGTTSIARAVSHRIRPFIAEMGGKNPVIVCESADVEAAVAGIARSAFGFSGQKCSATSRVYATPAVFEEITDRLAIAASKMVVGDPHDISTDLGPLINQEALDRFERTLARTRSDGRVVAGGEVVREGFERGFFVQPTVATDLPLDHPHFKEELFVPYVVVGRVDDLDHALREANSVPYGLTAGIFTREEDEIRRFFDEIEAGSIYANRAQGATAGAWPGVQAFGGWKDSGSSGRHALGPRYVAQFMREQSRTDAT